MENKVISREYVEKNYISIKELKKVLDIEEYDHIDVLSHISTLMSEVDRLEDIEDRKVQIEYQLVFDEGVKSVEDKIIAIFKKYGLDEKEYFFSSTSDIIKFIKDMRKLMGIGEQNMNEEIKTDHFKTMEELLKHLKIWEEDGDYDAYYRFFCPRCAYELAHEIEKQQKEIERLKENNKKLDRDIQILFTYFISKDEVREKAEDILSVFPDFDACAIELRKRFEELLGE